MARSGNLDRRIILPQPFERCLRLRLRSIRGKVYLRSCITMLNLCLSQRQIFAGHIPFVEEKFDPRVVLKVYSGQRPSRPPTSSLSDAVWQLITECWTHDPQMRPSAHRASGRLRRGLPESREVEPWDTFVAEKLRVPPEGPYCPSTSDIELRLRAATVSMDVTRSAEDWEERKTREAATRKVRAFDEQMRLYGAAELPIWEAEE